LRKEAASHPALILVVRASVNTGNRWSEEGFADGCPFDHHAPEDVRAEEEHDAQEDDQRAQEEHDDPQEDFGADQHRAEEEHLDGTQEDEFAQGELAQNDRRAQIQ
jgi:hypothetical protein